MKLRKSKLFVFRLKKEKLSISDYLQIEINILKKLKDMRTMALKNDISKFARFDKEFSL